MIPNVLSIAGSDPSGGAGVQADLKTFAALGVYGMAALTALTAQNTRGVTAVHAPGADFMRAQLDAIFADVRVDAVKIGMVWDAATITSIADVLAAHRPAHIVLDPVMVAASGDRLLAAEAEDALKTHLLPLADVVTPNLPEAAAFLGRDLPPEGAARALLDMGARAVVLKGGHGDGPESTDILLRTGCAPLVLSAPRLEGRAGHGTGCTLSAALAAFLALGADMPGAARAAKAYVTGAMAGADVLEVGGGPSGPLDHAWQTRGR
jgi:hydroxymethylpyrimidine/phosphomethylpyrimidine kinase